LKDIIFKGGAKMVCGQKDIKGRRKLGEKVNAA